jgi:peptidoglycan-associated lipoprotein
MRQFIKVIIACALILTITACTTHRRPAGLVDANRLHRGGAEAAETYTEGVNGEGSYAENSKCMPARPVPGTEQRYFFDFNSNEVRQEAIGSIKVQADYLIKHPNVKVRLEGNTDDRGSREYNVALGWRRAHAVLDVLKQYGVSASQVTLISYGAEKPAAVGEDEKSYQCNRRVDLKYTD